MIRTNLRIATVAAAVSILVLALAAFSGAAHAATRLDNPAAGVNITATTYEFDVYSDVAGMKNLSIYYNSSGANNGIRLCGNTSIAGQTFYNLTCTVNTVADGSYNFWAAVNDTITGAENSSVNKVIGLDFTDPTIPGTIDYTQFIYSDERQTINVSNASDTGFTDGIYYCELQLTHNQTTMNMSDIAADKFGLNYEPKEKGVTHGFRIRCYDYHGKNTGWTAVRNFDVSGAGFGEGGSSTPREERTVSIPAMVRGGPSTLQIAVGAIAAIVIILVVGWVVENMKGSKKGGRNR